MYFFNSLITTATKFVLGETWTTFVQLQQSNDVHYKYSWQGLVTEAKHHNKREIKDFEDPSTYWFETVLEFFNITEAITGKYICRVADDTELRKVHLYVYGKG
jgi:hypothetical protein